MSCSSTNDTAVPASAAGYSNPETRRAQTLETLKADGLTIGECIRTLAVPNDDPYVCRARGLILHDEELDMDEHTVTSVSEDGAWVLLWIWVKK